MPSCLKTAKSTKVIPGPAKYAGKYDAPTGPAPTVTPEQTGAFPNAEFQAKYVKYRDDWNHYADKMADLVNLGQPGTKSKSGLDSAALMEYSKNRNAQNAEFKKRLEEMKVEAAKLGYIKAAARRFTA